MNRYILIRRLYGPAFLLLVGVNALLNQAGILSWGRSWPLYLILVGVLQLAERAALSSEEPADDPYPGQPAVYPPAPQPTAPAATPGTSLMPVSHELVKRDEGGQQ